MKEKKCLVNLDVVMGVGSNSLNSIYTLLSEFYGQQPWWPADDLFEIMVGAILTQNTSWTNVEKAISNLKRHDLCNSQSLASIDQTRLGEIIRSSGYFNQKSKRLINFSRWYEAQGGFEKLMLKDLDTLRDELLSLNGVGPETADDILLYAFDKPSFVIDTYTRRIFSRLGLLEEKASYEELQLSFHAELITDVPLFQQYHALIVTHAKRHCMKTPQCYGCPAIKQCTYESK